MPFAAAATAGDAKAKIKMVDIAACDCDGDSDVGRAASDDTAAFNAIVTMLNALLTNSHARTHRQMLRQAQRRRRKKKL